MRPGNINSRLRMTDMQANMQQSIRIEKRTQRDEKDHAVVLVLHIAYASVPYRDITMHLSLTAYQRK